MLNAINSNLPPSIDFDRDENGEIKVEKGETKVLLTTWDNKKFQVTVKGSETLLHDETRVKNIALELLLLANVYDVSAGGKTQSLTLKNPTHLGKTIIEQNRTQSKAGQNATVTAHEGDSVLDILQQRRGKLERKLEEKKIDLNASKHSLSILQQKLNEVNKAIQTLTKNQNVQQEKVDEDVIEEDLPRLELAAPKAETEMVKKFEPVETLNQAEEERRAENRDALFPVFGLNALFLENALSATISPEPSLMSPSPRPLFAQPSPQAQIRLSEAQQINPALPKTTDQKSSLFDQIRAGKQLKKIERIKVNEEKVKTSKNNPAIQSLSNEEMLRRALAKRKERFEPEGEDEEDNQFID